MDADYHRHREEVLTRTPPAGRPDAAPPDAAAAVIASREARLFIVLSGLFVTNAIIAEFVGVEVFALEATLGIAPRSTGACSGRSGSLSFTAGVLLWPVVFVMTDVINEHFGRPRRGFISWLAARSSSYAFLFAYVAIHVTPADWWVTVGSTARGVPDTQAAFSGIFGQGLWVDRPLGGSRSCRPAARHHDLSPGAADHRRALGVAPRDGLDAVSQLIDSFVVLYVAFVSARSTGRWCTSWRSARSTTATRWRWRSRRPLPVPRRRAHPRVPAPAARRTRLMPRPRTPEVATDVVIELEDRPGRPVVVIRRGHPPEGHALPGGFVEIGESVEQAAVARSTGDQPRHPPRAAPRRLLGPGT